MPDTHKIYYDDESYNQGHGRAYEFLGINPSQGAIVIVRPDQCMSPILASMSDTDNGRCIRRDGDGGL